MYNNFFKKYLLPGFIFQSVIIGGGYGTGREIVEFFLSHGPLEGILGMLLVTTTVWAVFLALIFEFSRKFKAFNYKDFFKHLLGKYWFIFEIIFFINILLVLAVLCSASGVILRDDFGLPYFFGVVIMMLLVGFFTFKGSDKIEKFLSWWSFLLYAVYMIFLVIIFTKFGDRIIENFSHSGEKGNWPISSLKYAFYNLAGVVGVIFCIRHIQTRREAISAGILAGIIGIIPGIFLFVGMTAFYPEIITEEIPSLLAFKQTGIKSLFIAFEIILFGTLIETGTALIHAVNERVFASEYFKEKKKHQLIRPLIAISILLIAVALSFFGIIDLIAKGYGIISWGFLLVLLLPMATIGVYKIFKKE